MEKYILSSNELAVLNALWDAERPLTRSEMLQSIHKTDWNPNSIHMVLNNLIRKGFVQVGETVRCGQNYGRTYFPLKTREECVIHMTTQIMPDISEDERVIHLMSAMAKSKGVSQHTIQKLEQMLEEMRKTLREESAGPEKEG